MALIALGIPLPIYAAVAISVIAGFICLERGTGLHAAWLGGIYVPTMFWLVALFTGVVGYFVGFGER